MITGERHGTVTAPFGPKGFTFIDEDGGPRRFCHVKAVEGRQHLAQGDRVAFVVSRDPSGQERCLCVRPLSPAAPSGHAPTERIGCGRISAILPNGEAGFIVGDGGEEFYFRMDAVQPLDAAVRTSARVWFQPVTGRGRRREAHDVRLID